MSIILDALKRAENLRKKNQPPTLMSATTSSPRANYRVIVLAVGFVSTGLCTWLLWPSDPGAPTASVDEKANVELSGSPAPQTESNTPAGIIEERTLITDAPVQPVQIAAAGAVPALDQAMTHSAALQKLGEATPQVSVPMLAQPLTQPATLYAQQAAQQEKLRAQQAAAMTPPAPVNEQPTEPISPPIASPAIVAAQTQQAATNEPSPPALPTIFELDYPVRLALPKMLVSMYVYNNNPEFRFLIVNGKKVRQGEQVESSVTFTEIRRDGVECEYQGTRFFFPRASS